MLANVENKYGFMQQILFKISNILLNVLKFCIMVSIALTNNVSLGPSSPGSSF